MEEAKKVVVSIHAPREGCDIAKLILILSGFSFNSRTPGGVRHRMPTYKAMHTLVSIHAPREGCDDAGSPAGW